MSFELKIITGRVDHPFRWFPVVIFFVILLKCPAHQSRQNNLVNNFYFDFECQTGRFAWLTHSSAILPVIKWKSSSSMCAHCDLDLHWFIFWPNSIIPVSCRNWIINLSGDILNRICLQRLEIRLMDSRLFHQNAVEYFYYKIKFCSQIDLKSFIRSAIATLSPGITCKKQFFNLGVNSWFYL